MEPIARVEGRFSPSYCSTRRSSRKKREGLGHLLDIAFHGALKNTNLRHVLSRGLLATVLRRPLTPFSIDFEPCRRPIFSCEEAATLPSCCEPKAERETIMSESTPESNIAGQKLESGAAHAKAAIDETTAAAKEVYEAGKKRAQSAISSSKDHLSQAAKDLGEAANVKYQDLRSQATQKAGEYKGRAQQVFSTTTSKAQDFQGDAEQIHPRQSAPGDRHRRRRRIRAWIDHAALNRGSIITLQPG